MQAWDDFVDWFYSPAGQTVLLGAVLPFVAILVSGIIATAIARGSIKRLLRNHDRELKAAAVIGLLDSARQASVWHSLLPNEQLAADRSMGAADVQLRMLPIPGASVAANWAGHEIREFKRASATFTLQFDAPLAEFRDRLIDWEHNPRRARKIFERDLARWSEDRAKEDRLRQQEQEEWAAQQAAPSDDAGRGPVTIVPAPPQAAPTHAAPTRAAPTPAPHAPATPSGPALVRSAPSGADRPPRAAPDRPMQPFSRPEPARSESARDESAHEEPGRPEWVRADPPRADAARPTAVAAFEPETDSSYDLTDRSTESTGRTTVPPRLLGSADDDDADITTVMPPIGSRPLRSPTLHQRQDVEQPGAVERPTDEPYAPPIPASFGRSRPES